jgi:hypothetical protein
MIVRAGQQDSIFNGFIGYLNVCAKNPVENISNVG